MNNFKNNLILVSTVVLIISDYVYSDHICKITLRTAGFTNSGEDNLKKQKIIEKKPSPPMNAIELKWWNEYNKYLKECRKNPQCCGLINNTTSVPDVLGINVYCCIKTLNELSFGESVNENLFQLLYNIPNYDVVKLNSLDDDIENYAEHLQPNRPSIRDVATYAAETGWNDRHLSNVTHSMSRSVQSNKMTNKGKSVINSWFIIRNEEYTNNIIRVLEESTHTEENTDIEDNSQRSHFERANYHAKERGKELRKRIQTSRNLYMPDENYFDKPTPASNINSIRNIGVFQLDDLNKNLEKYSKYPQRFLQPYDSPLFNNSYTEWDQSPIQDNQTYGNIEDNFQRLNFGSANYRAKERGKERGKRSQTSRSLYMPNDKPKPASNINIKRDIGVFQLDEDLNEDYPKYNEPEIFLPPSERPIIDERSLQQDRKILGVTDYCMEQYFGTTD